MEKYVILPDVTCDLDEDIRSRYDIEIVYGHVTYPGGVEQPAVLNWNDCAVLTEHTAEEFYTALKKNPDGYTTAPASVYEYVEAFEKYVSQGYGVLSMSISSGMSATYDFSCQAKALVLQKYPDAKIMCFDSLRFGPGFGLMAVYASILRGEGKSLEEVYAYLEENKNRFHQMGWLDDLSFVAKKGRISHPKAFFGTLVGVKPIGEFEATGKTTVIGKAKGEKSAYVAMLKYIENTIENPEEQIIFIAHTNRRAQAHQFKAMIEEKFHPKYICVNDVFPSCGINVGPGLMAAYYIGKPISADLSEEKELLSKILQGEI